MRVSQLTDKELKQLVINIHQNKVFISNNPDGVDASFGLVLMMMEPRQMPDPESIGAIYEYIDKAGPVAINGQPMFFSLRFLAVEDLPKVIQGIERMKQAVTEVSV